MSGDQGSGIGDQGIRDQGAGGKKPRDVRARIVARVARELLKLGLRVAVIEDGLRGWRAAGLKVEAVPPEELAALPFFI